MSDYLVVLNRAMKEAVCLILENQEQLQKNGLEIKNRVRDLNKAIENSYLEMMPNDSMVNIISYFLQHYKYQRLKCEGRAIPTNVIFTSKIIPFSTVAKYRSSFFSFPNKLNDAIFYIRLVEMRFPHKRKELVADLESRYQLQGLPRKNNDLKPLLRQYFLELSGRDSNFADEFTSDNSIRILSMAIHVKTSLSVTQYYSIKTLDDIYSNFRPHNIFILLMDAMVELTEMESAKTHSISRHPSWCNYNKTGKCEEFNKECHSTIGCPFFKKGKKLPSGAIKLG